MSYSYSDGQPNSWSAETLREKCKGFADTFVRERNAFVYRNQDILLEALRQDAVKEAVPA
jgi:hypothetical protein